MVQEVGGEKDPDERVAEEGKNTCTEKTNLRCEIAEKGPERILDILKLDKIRKAVIVTEPVGLTDEFVQTLPKEINILLCVIGQVLITCCNLRNNHEDQNPQNEDDA